MRERERERERKSERERERERASDTIQKLNSWKSIYLTKTEVIEKLAYRQVEVCLMAILKLTTPYLLLAIITRSVCQSIGLTLFSEQNCGQSIGLTEIGGRNQY